MDCLDKDLAHSYEITSESRIQDELGDFFDSIYLNDHVSLREEGMQTVLDQSIHDDNNLQVEDAPSSSTSNTKRIRKESTRLRDYNLGTSQRKKKRNETQINEACKFSKSFSTNTEFLNQDDLFCLTKVTTLLVIIIRNK